jgi:hypothetical protein
MEGNMGGFLALLLLTLTTLITPLVAQGDFHPLKVLLYSHYFISPSLVEMAHPERLEC